MKWLFVCFIIMVSEGHAAGHMWKAEENSLESLSPSTKTQAWNSILHPWQQKFLYTHASHFSGFFLPLDLTPIYELSQYWKWYAQLWGLYFKFIHLPKIQVKLLHLQQIQLSTYQTCLMGFLLPLDWSTMCNEWKWRASPNLDTGASLGLPSAPNVLSNSSHSKMTLSYIQINFGALFHVL